MDSDDFYDCKLLEKEYEQIEKHNADICACNGDHYNEKTKKYELVDFFIIDKYDHGKMPFQMKDCPDYIFQVIATGPWLRMYRLDFIREHNLKYQSIIRGNDVLFSNMALALAKKITVVNEILVHHRIGMTHNLQSGIVDTPDIYLDIELNLKRELEKRNLFKICRRSFGLYVLYNLRAHYSSGDENVKRRLEARIKKGILNELGFMNYFIEKIKEYTSNPEQCSIWEESACVELAKMILQLEFPEKTVNLIKDIENMIKNMKRSVLMNLYAFPYDKVKYGSKIIIYGAGCVGQNYLNQVLITKYCEIECMADKNFSKYSLLPVEVCAPEDIKNKNYDAIVVANNISEIANEIIDDLINKYGVDRRKIIYENKYIEPVDVIYDDELSIPEENFSYSKKDKYPIAILLTGGFGDFVIRKENIREVTLWNENISLDIYVYKSKEKYTQILFNDIAGINLIIGSQYRYRKNKNKYMASLHFSAFLKIDYLNADILNEIPEDLSNKLKKLQYEYLRYGLKDFGCLFALHYARCRLDGLNCYTAYNRYGVFNIKEAKTTIPLLKEYESAFNELKLTNYITLNYGWGRTLNTRTPPAKVWPFEYYEELAKLIKKQYPQFIIVQIGMEDSSEINGCDSYIFGKDLEVIKYVLKNSLLHIDCEGGLVHIATQLGTKCAVLFGPTPVEYYGYESNINIVSKVCKGCCWYVPDCFSCYREMENPKCMSSILPKDVMENVKKYLKKCTTKVLQKNMKINLKN